jgi:hypothetical protein
MSDERIEATLTSLAESGNSDLPVAARLQQRPDNVADLVRDPEPITVQASRRGVVYKLSERPRQSRRPRPLSLATDQKRAVQLEVDRLHHKCHAIERVEEHDGHKALLYAKAKQYERQPFPMGQWPREDPVPICYTEEEVRSYDQQQLRKYLRAKATGRPLRDFESGVFCVGKSDGGWGLCTDYRKFNDYSARSKFQMEGVQCLAELIQLDDFAMLVDLKDCYLTMGLHSAHRKYCRFRSPDGHRYQWQTVSFGSAEAHQVYTKILRPLIKILSL